VSGKKWVVADLDDDYIAKMEDVLEVYERPHDPQQLMICLDEKPVTLHADVRPASPAAPKAKTIHLVMDNLNIHRRKALADVFGPQMAAEVWDGFTVHYTPTHGSWLNQAEIEIGIFSRQCLGN
jgi:DDE superfamily endonuclease